MAADDSGDEVAGDFAAQVTGTVAEVSVDFSKMTDEEIFRYEHERLHKLHAGHETMHLEMFVLLLFTLICAQILLFEWRKRHYKSYQLATMCTMWFVPFAISIHFHWWRFLCVWVFYSVVTGYVTIKARRKPIEGTTPRLVYKWFYAIHKTTYGLGLIGYMIIMLTLLGVNMVFKAKPDSWMDFGFHFLVYGLYYGVLGRDFAELCTDSMAATIGYYTSSGIPLRKLDSNVCAVCGNPIIVQSDEDAIIEKTYKLNCNHIFHEFCIRGWCIVGKKQTCPYCKEKVDLKRMFCNPWEKPHVLFGQLLDFVRYMVAWQPVVLFFVQIMYRVMDLH